ncbi:uncharacterized protein [Polyergus mexicanus]|uniref:uncharacterized protein n=1 Tax=Polyergus mexicanus TaxID=615972 RepID=UPI0038B6A34E
MSGYNNNPNCIQFTSAYKRLLHHNEVKSSAAANCLPLDNTSLLTISSKQIKKSFNELKEEDIEDVTVDDIPLQFVKSTIHHTVLYISGIFQIVVLETLVCAESLLILIVEVLSAVSHSRLDDVALMVSQDFYSGPVNCGKSARLRDTFYNSSWYNNPPSHTKLLSICITRSEKPLMLTAGKFYTLSLNTFTNIVKTSMAYLSILRNFVEK